MKYHIETRKQVKDTAADHDTKSKGKQKELSDTRADKETAAATAKELNQAGTKEGRDAVRKAMEAVGQKIDRHFDKRSAEAREIRGETAEAAEVLGSAKEQTDKDAQQIERAKQQMKERESGADAELDQAAQMSKEERDILAEAERLEKVIGEDLERIRLREQGELKKAEVKTKE